MHPSSRSSTQSELIDNLEDIKNILDAKIDSITKFRIFYLIFSFIPLVLLFFFNNGNEYLVLLKNVLLTLMIVYFAIFLYLSKSMEKKWLRAVLDDVNLMLENISDQNCF